MASTEHGRAFGVQWTVHRQHGLVTVSLTGELDLASVDQVQEMADGVFEEVPVVVFDLRDLAFLDSTGLRMFGRMHQRAHKEGRRFLLGQVSAPVRRVLHIAGLLDYFDYVEGAPPSDRLCKACDNFVEPDAARCPFCGVAL